MEFRSIFSDFEGHSYLDDGSSTRNVPEDALDCSLGVNPFGHSEKIDEWMIGNISNINVTDYPAYPYTDLKAKIARYLKDQVDLDAWNIGLSTGSMGVLIVLNRMFIDPGSKVLMSAPSFSSYETEVRLMGGSVEYCYLKKGMGYRFDANEFTAKMNDSHRLFYIDDPNNPTGQIIPVADIEKCVKKARDLDRAIIVDEAYGEFMPIENSASSLLEEYRNLIVVKSFSKGFGLAGLRGGYAMMDKPVADIFTRANIEMSLNEFAYRTVAMVFDDLDHVRDSLGKIAEIKRAAISSLVKLKAASTGDTVPIMLIYSEKDVDLYEIFLKHGVITEAGADFSGLGRNAVRVRVPADDRLRRKLEEIEITEDV